MKRAHLFTLGRLGIAISILGYLFHLVPLDKVLSAAASASLPYLVIAVVLILLHQLLFAYRVKCLADWLDLKFTFRHLLAVNHAAIFYGLFLPGGNLAGSAVRLYQLARQTTQVNELLTLLAFDRLLATLALCLLGLAAGFTCVFLPEDLSGCTLSPVPQASFLMGLFVIGATTSGIPLQRFGCPPFLPIPARIRALIKPFTAFQALPRPYTIRMLFLALAGQVWGALIFFVLVQSLEIPLSLLAIAWIRSVVLLITMLPLSISGLGLREGALYFILTPYGIPGDKILAFSLLVFGITVLFIGAVGALIETRRMLTTAKTI